MLVKKLLECIEEVVDVRAWTQRNVVEVTINAFVLWRSAGRASGAAGMVRVGSMLEPVWATRAEYSDPDQRHVVCHCRYGTIKKVYLRDNCRCIVGVLLTFRGRVMGLVCRTGPNRGDFPGDSHIFQRKALWRRRRLFVRILSGSLRTLHAINCFHGRRVLAAIMRGRCLDVAEGAYAIQILEHVTGCGSRAPRSASRINSHSSSLGHHTRPRWILHV